MLSKIVVSGMCLMLFSTSLMAQDTLTFQVNQHNNIVLEAVLNDQDSVRLMFHTGISDVSIIEDQAPSLKWVAEDSVESWGGSSASRVSTSNTLVVEGFQWDDVNIWECQRSGPETDGKIGLTYFEDKFVTFDFDQRHLIISEHAPQDLSGYAKCPITEEQGSLFVQLDMTIDSVNYQHSFLVHSGYGGCLLLDDVYANEHQLSEKLKIIDQSILKDSYGNEIAVNKAELPKVAWSGIALENVPVGFFSGEIARQHMSVLGADFMRRFEIIVDAKREYLYLKSSSILDQDFSKI